MKKNILLKAIFLALPMTFSPFVFAAAPAAAPNQQSTPPAEHAGHGAPTGSGDMAGMKGSGSPAAWTAFPTLKIRMGGEGRGRTFTVVPQNIVANSIDAYSNDIKDANGHRELPLDMAGAKLDRPAAGGFHWLAAREEQPDLVLVASTVHFFAGSDGQNPTAMFMQRKHELEIVPQPFPREHSRYRANEDWKFVVRFNGNPVANQKVFLETMNGTRTELVSDALGVITAHIPDDFNAEAQQKSAGSHDHGRRSSDFVLATEHAEGGKTYLTAFNGSYGTDAFYQRSLAMGLGFTLLGMIGAVPLLRHRKDAKRAADTKTAADEAVNKKDA
jgi:hypothetical protein